MTKEMYYSLQPGTRVTGVEKYGGHTPGECGTVLHFTRDGHRAVIRWDNFESQRHNGDGTVQHGHGWWVPYELLQIAEQVDLGDFSESTTEVSIEDLFGGVM